MESADLQTRFGSAVRARRKRLGISQEELAERAGLHRTYVADVERGARNLSLGSIRRLASALQVSIASLFTQAEARGELAGSDAGEVLLVHSDPGVAEATVRTFAATRLVNRLHEARSGEEALQMLLGEPAGATAPLRDRLQLILLDLELQGMNALELLRRLKADRLVRNIPVVALAGADRAPDTAESLRLGAESAIPKPIDFNRLAGLIPKLSFGWAILKSSPAPALGAGGA
ncbi:MAG: helix-turn-helix domain-containing protein [Verrucomicrobiota bacterium]